MNIILSDRNADLTGAWREVFASEKNAMVTSESILSVECDAIVSPANSFGFMDGGLDLQLSLFLGWHVRERVQALIRARPMGELLVGEAVVVPTGHPGIPWLICAPTMRVPMIAKTTVNSYLAMKAVLVAAKAHEAVPSIRTIAIPGLATGVGKMIPVTAARQMHAAYVEVVHGNAIFPASFGDAQRAHVRLNRDANLSEY
jgi:O-acetyl-ADP-ribose deacetylase (regulator of RNase III)